MTEVALHLFCLFFKLGSKGEDESAEVKKISCCKRIKVRVFVLFAIALFPWYDITLNYSKVEGNFGAECSVKYQNVLIKHLLFINAPPLEQMPQSELES